MQINIDSFRGIRPRYAPEKIPQIEAQTAENTKLIDGDLKPWDNYLLEQLLVNKGTILTVRLHEENWFEWEAVVDFLDAPIAGDTQGKFYYTGDGFPKKSNTEEATTGSGAKPINYYPLALPSPLSALTGTVGGPPDGSGDPRFVSYIWTVVSSWSEESYPSDASDTYQALNGEKIALSGMSLEWKASTTYATYNSVFEVSDEGGTYLYKCIQAGTTAGSEPTWNQTVGGLTIDGSVIWQCFENNLLYKRIYRLNVGEQYAKYQLVSEIAISATTYDDTTADADLEQTICPTLSDARGGSAFADHDPPDDDLRGICLLGNGIALMYKGKDVYPSIAYKMNAFPIEFSQTVPEPIVSITSSGLGTAIIGTTLRQHVIVGSSPESITIDPLPDTMPNVSKRSAVPYGNGVVYAAPDGLRYVDATSNTLLTKDFYTTEEWELIFPSTMHAVVHQRKYFGFYKSGDTEGGIVIDLQSGVISKLDFYCTAAYVDPSTDTLYFIGSTQMSQFKEFLQNPDARSTSGKATQYDLTGGPGIMAGIVQPDYPRNIVVNLTDANASISALSITIAGTLADGTSGSETKTDLSVGANDLNYAFAQIDSITINSVTGAGAGDVIDIGWGKKFGLGNAIDTETDIIKVLINDDDSPVANQTISTAYDTIEFATDPDATNDYMVMYITD